MKQIRILATLMLAGCLSLISCDSYFDVELDNQATMDEIFSQRTTAKRYLQHIYSYLPLEEEIVGSEGWVVARADEAQYSFYQWVYYIPYMTGNYGTATPDSGSTPEQYFNFWSKCYKAINQCSIFLANIDKDKDDTPQVVEYMKAEARFLRAFYYFCLFRQYGPVYIWGDRISDETIQGASIDRHTVEENIDFIVSELDAIKDILPLRVGDIESEDLWQGRITRGAALALKSRVLLYAASPLYNGCDLYKGQMKNMRGDYLFPQTPDENKWQEAADAAWEVIQMTQYSLCKRTSTSTTGDKKFKDGAASYQAVMFEPWNEETIWGWWRRTSDAYNYTGTTGIIQALAPFNGVIPNSDPQVSYNTYISPATAGFGGIAPSLKLVDSYPMWESGRYPVTGYQGQNDLSKPIVDEKSGYQATGFTEGYQQPVDADWAPAFKAHNSCVGRDPRFYSSVVPNGFYFPKKDANTRFTCYNNAKECSSPYSATSGCIRVGYIWRRMYKADQSLNTLAELQAIKYVYPTFRLAEIYLNYAEACNEKPQRDEASALEYLNKVRNRVGLNNIEEAYPEIKGNKELLRWCIQKERMVEFAFECQRHYDVCRWMIAKDEYPSKQWTLHLTADNYEDSYERVSNELPLADNAFTDRDYLFPISSSLLSEMTNITQNYGF